MQIKWGDLMFVLLMITYGKGQAKKMMPNDFYIAGQCSENHCWRGLYKFSQHIG